MTASVASGRKVCIRRCTDVDIAYLSDLRNRLAPHFLSQKPATPEKTWRRLLVQSNAWVLEVDGKPAGVYALSHDEGAVEFRHFMVEPSLHRNGYGRMMLCHAIEKARSWRASHLYLTAKAGNEAAWALYVEMGFQVTQVHMELRLD